MNWAPPITKSRQVLHAILFALLLSLGFSFYSNPLQAGKCSNTHKQGGQTIDKTQYECIKTTACQWCDDAVKGKGMGLQKTKNCWTINEKKDLICSAPKGWCRIGYEADSESIRCTLKRGKLDCGADTSKVQDAFDTIKTSFNPPLRLAEINARTSTQYLDIYLATVRAAEEPSATPVFNTFRFNFKNYTVGKSPLKFSSEVIYSALPGYRNYIGFEHPGANKSPWPGKWLVCDGEDNSPTIPRSPKERGPNAFRNTYASWLYKKPAYWVGSKPPKIDTWQKRLIEVDTLFQQSSNEIRITWRKSAKANFRGAAKIVRVTKQESEECGLEATKKFLCLDLVIQKYELAPKDAKNSRDLLWTTMERNPKGQNSTRLLRIRFAKTQLTTQAQDPAKMIYSALTE